MNTKRSHSAETERRIRLKADARNAMPGFYPKLILSAFLVYLVDLFLTESLPVGPASLSGNILYYLSTAIIFLVICLLKVGLCRQSLSISREQLISVSDVLFTFRNHPDHLLLAYVRMLPMVILGAVVPVSLILFRVPLAFASDYWGALLFSLGLTALAYLLIWICLLPFAMTGWLYADHPELSSAQLIRKSREMMQGEYKRYLMINLSFIGYYLLGLLSIGLALPWVSSYRRTTLAHYYLELSQKATVSKGE